MTCQTESTLRESGSICALRIHCSAFQISQVYHADLPPPAYLCEQAMVNRSQAPELGPKHVDTQLACHNLGCILDRLGCTHRALDLLETAHEVGVVSLTICVISSRCRAASAAAQCLWPPCIATPVLAPTLTACCAHA